MPQSPDVRPVAVGIAGASASGKSTFARDLAAALAPARTAIVAQDSYYRSLPPGAAPGRHNFDEPGAVDLDRMARDVGMLMRGRAARVPVYDFARHRRASRARRVAPAPIIIVEGLHVLFHEALRSLLDVKVYIDCPLAECLRRRLARDSRERGRDAAGIIRQFQEQVAPMHDRYVAPSARFAEHILALPDRATPEYAAGAAQIVRAIEARAAAAAGAAAGENAV